MAAGRLLYLHLLVIALVVLVMRLNLRESREWTTARDVHLAGVAARPPGRTRERFRWSFADLGRPAAGTVLALGFYYTAWNIGANTLGQFKPYLWIEVMGGSPRGASILILLGLPLGLILSAAFVVVVDTPSRQRWIMAGALTSLSGWLVITVWPTREAFVYLAVSFAAGAHVRRGRLQGWTQRLIPTMCSCHDQGATLAVARVAAALAAAATHSW